LGCCLTDIGDYALMLIISWSPTPWAAPCAQQQAAVDAGMKPFGTTDQIDSDTGEQHHYNTVRSVGQGPFESPFA